VGTPQIDGPTPVQQFQIDGPTLVQQFQIDGSSPVQQFQIDGPGPAQRPLKEAASISGTLRRGKRPLY
jgi:hypothetical protein